MLPTTVLAYVVALASGSQAAAIVARNKHVADFRLFAAQGCHDKNQGIWTVIDDDFTNGECKSLNNNETKSVLTVDTLKSCKLYVYTDAHCRHGRQLIPEHECRGSDNGLKAWSMHCEGHP